MALVLALSALVFAPTAGAVTHPTKTYLALGDSLAFGYTQVKHTENAPGDSPAFFEKGYTNYYAKKVRGNKTEDNKAMVEVNDGCPGETSKSFLGEGTNIGLAPTATTRRCSRRSVPARPAARCTTRTRVNRRPPTCCRSSKAAARRTRSRRSR